MKIKNFDELATTPLRAAALEIIEAGLEAIDTKKIIRESISLENQTLTVKGQKYELVKNGKLLLVGIGKCAAYACEELENILNNNIQSGIVLDIRKANTKIIKSIVGTHPLPSEENKRGTKEIINTLRGLTKDDCVIFVISGGGSTLLSYNESLTPEEEAKIVKALFSAGTTIEELNTLRKHTSLARGGQLAKYAYPARIISCIFSDVPGNNIQTISSGPTVKDETTIEDAKEIMKRHNLTLNKKTLLETPKEEKYFNNVENIILVSNETALSAMEKKATTLGFHAEVKNTKLVGEAKEVGIKIINELHAYPKNTALLYGGETTVKMTGNGEGGRNQELSLGALDETREEELLVSVASDGRDNSDYAGGIVDSITKSKAKLRNLTPSEYLSENSSYTFFKQTESGILIGSAGSNVSDIIIALKE